jgi:hypothetical protein
MTRRLTAIAASLLVAIPLASCGGSSSGSPAPAPSPTLTSIAIALAEFVFLGGSEQATATGMLSNGTSQAVTGTWSTDNPDVATVDANGRVTALRSGRVTVLFQSQGLTGSRATRVVPNYEGAWIGTYRLTSCTESGDFVGEDLCKDFFETVPRPPAALAAVQTSRGSIDAIAFLGLFETAPVTAAIADDGSVTFTGTITGEEGLTITTTWTIRLEQPGGHVTGVVDQTWQVAGFTGNIRITADDLDLEFIGETMAAMNRPRGATPRTLREAILAALR